MGIVFCCAGWCANGIATDFSLLPLEREELIGQIGLIKSIDRTMKTTRIYILLALLLMAGEATMQAQTEDDFWKGIDPPTTGVYSLIEDAEGNIIVGATGVYNSSDDGATWSLIGLDDIGVLCLYEHTDGTLLAGTNRYHSLYKREAGSTEWTALPVPTTTNGVSIGVTSDNSLLLGTWEGVYKSTDWDSTWTNWRVLKTVARL